MNGSPVWLASISRRSRLTGKTLATSLWTPPLLAASIALLRRLVGPAGDKTRERVFRMNVTVCLHRALSQDDISQLPPHFFTDPPIDLAGGPVEILEETEVGLLTTRPCHDPVRVPLDPRNPLLWFPGDCRRCGPCQARLALAIERLEGAHAEAIST